jgi:hypothetical protein
LLSRKALPEEVKSALLISPSHSEDSLEDIHVDEEFTAPQQILKRNDLIRLTVPHKRLLTGTVELATRCRVSNRTATALVANVVKMGGRELKDCTLSARSSYRQRKSHIKQSADHIKEDFRGNSTKFLILHWDSKIIKYMYHHKN